jgi:hypothetical protein
MEIGNQDAGRIAVIVSHRRSVSGIVESQYKGSTMNILLADTFVNGRPAKGCSRHPGAFCPRHFVDSTLRNTYDQDFSATKERL